MSRIQRAFCYYCIPPTAFLGPVFSGALTCGYYCAHSPQITLSKYECFYLPVCGKHTTLIVLRISLRTGRTIHFLVQPHPQVMCARAQPLAAEEIPLEFPKAFTA